jgi:hypothetical protein
MFVIKIKNKDLYNKRGQSCNYYSLTNINNCDVYKTKNSANSSLSAIIWDLELVKKYVKDYRDLTNEDFEIREVKLTLI